MDLNDGWSPQALRNDWPKKCGCLFQGWHVSEHHANHLNLTPTQNSQDHSVKKINKPIMFFEMNLIGLRSPMISHGSLASPCFAGAWSCWSWPLAALGIPGKVVRSQFRLQFHQFSNDLDLYFHFLLKTKQHGHAGEESTSCNLHELKFRFVRTFKGIKQSTVKSILSCHPNHHWQKWSDLIQGPLRWGCGQKQSCSSVLSPQSGRNGQAAFHGW